MRRPDHGRLRLLLTPGLLLALVMAAGAVSAAAPPQVTAAGEALVGEWELGGRVMAFKGVPFAAPPVGAGRWMPPEPVWAVFCRRWDSIFPPIFLLVFRI